MKDKENYFEIEGDCLVSMTINNPKEVIIPDTVERIAFSPRKFEEANTSKLINIKGIDAEITKTNNKIQKLIIPKTVKYVDRSFEGLNIKEVQLFAKNERKNLMPFFEQCNIDKLEVHQDNTHAICHRCKIKNLVFDNAITSISVYAFSHCCIKKIEFSENLEVILKNAFRYLTGLDKIIFPKSLKFIDNDAFCASDSLKKVEFSEGLEYIAKNAFTACHNISTINLPESLILFEPQAFDKCENLNISIYEDTVTNTKKYKDILIENFDIKKNTHKVPYKEFITSKNKLLATISEKEELVIPCEIEIINDFAIPDFKYKKIILPATLKDASRTLPVCTPIDIPENVYNKDYDYFSKTSLNFNCIPMSLDNLISSGRSISEINRIFKTREEER